MDRLKQLKNQRDEINNQIKKLETDYYDKTITEMVGKYYKNDIEYIRTIGRSGSRGIKYINIEFFDDDVYMTVEHEDIKYIGKWTEISSEEYYKVLEEAMFKLQKEYDTRP